MSAEMHASNGIPQRVVDGWHIHLDDGTVTLISIDHALGLEIWVDVDSSLHVRIEARFTYSDDSGNREVEWTEPSELGPFASLHGGIVETIDLADSGDMVIRFADGRAITVAPLDRYEAFQLSSRKSVADGGFLFVCVPGGGLSIWLRPVVTITRVGGAHSAGLESKQKLDSIGPLPRGALAADLLARGLSQIELDQAFAHVDRDSLS